MSDNVQFDTDIQTSGYRAPTAPASYGGTDTDLTGISGWLVRHHLAKSAASAEIIMTVVILADLAATFIIIKYFIL